MNNLKPDTSYIFLVRAENSHGMSPPSAVSERVRTLRLFTALHMEEDMDDGTPHGTSSFNGVSVSEVQDTLMNRVVELTSIEAISSTTIR